MHVFSENQVSQGMKGTTRTRETAPSETAGSLCTLEGGTTKSDMGCTIVPLRAGASYTEGKSAQLTPKTQVAVIGQAHETALLRTVHKSLSVVIRLTDQIASASFSFKTFWIFAHDLCSCSCAILSDTCALLVKQHCKYRRG